MRIGCPLLLLLARSNHPIKKIGRVIIVMTRVSCVVIIDIRRCVADTFAPRLYSSLRFASAEIMISGRGSKKNISMVISII